VRVRGGGHVLRVWLTGCCLHTGRSTLFGGASSAVSAKSYRVGAIRAVVFCDEVRGMRTLASSKQLLSVKSEWWRYDRRTHSAGASGRTPRPRRSLAPFTSG
jgi:hypothetical protein